MVIKKTNFTILELLIVVAIIGILVSLLLPSLQKARLKSKIIVCRSNQSQIYKALLMMANNGTANYSWKGLDPRGGESGENSRRSGDLAYTHYGLGTERVRRLEEIDLKTLGQCAPYLTDSLDEDIPIYYCPTRVSSPKYQNINIFPLSSEDIRRWGNSSGVWNVDYNYRRYFQEKKVIPNLNIHESGLAIFADHWRKQRQIYFHGGKDNGINVSYIDGSSTALKIGTIDYGDVDFAANLFWDNKLDRK